MLIFRVRFFLLFSQNIDFLSRRDDDMHRRAVSWQLIIRSSLAGMRAGFVRSRPIIGVRLQRELVPRNLVSITPLQLMTNP